jgi:tetratricopeptide (TPR) repeat protein
MIEKAIELIQAGEYQQAEDILRAEIAEHPDHIQARLSLAYLQLSTADFSGIEETLLPVLQIDPVNMQALVFLGAALLESGRSKDAIKYLQRVTRRDSDNVQAQFCLARAFFAEGKAPFAEPCLQKALKVEPGNGELLDWLGRVQLELNRIDAAKQSFDMARKAGENNPGLLKGLARVETILGNIEVAIALTADAVEQAPLDFNLAFQYSEMLIEQGQYDVAIQQLERLRTSGYQPDKVTALLANAYARMGQQNKALTLLAELQKKPSIPPDVRLLLSIALRLCDQAATADEHLEILLRMQPSWADAVLIKGKLLYRKNDKAAIDMLVAFLKRRDINSWQIHEAKTMLAFALDKAGYEPINPPKRETPPGSITPAKEVESDAFSSGPTLADASVGVPVGMKPGLLLDPNDFPIPGKLQNDDLAVSAMDKKVTASWPTQPPEDGLRQPVFVYAWPGSGSEMLLGALAQHPRLAYMPDDEPSESKRRAKLTDRFGANGLGGLDKKQIEINRKQYWRAVGGDIELPEGTVQVDLQKLGAEMLPAISRYFPGATVIVLTRDPRDMAVVWKEANHPQLDEFTSLYQSQLQQLNMCRDSLPLNFVNVTYEDMCEDPESALELVQRAIGVEPDVKVVNKMTEVIEKYSPESGQWKNHEADMAGIFAKFK